MGMIERFEDTPFEKSKQHKIQDEYYYAVYEDKWPVCDGHLLFVPKENNVRYLVLALEATVEYGNKLQDEGKIDAYHFGMNMGEAAGQTVMWPHIHFMPRHQDDAEGFPGSVRLACRNGKNASYYFEHPDFKEEYTKAHEELLKHKGTI
jgi:diadenosine tetraphosphate (Ap4A) HIT family hydrolase|tara:strand:- start:4541 stop:4987 length:447 start_codon:yes stop_codon:yes gene_type:complete